MNILSLTFVSESDAGLVYDVDHRVGLFKKKTITTRVFISKIPGEGTATKVWSTGEYFNGSILDAYYLTNLILHNYKTIQQSTGLR